MKLRTNRLQKWFLAPLFGLLFAFFLCFVNSDKVEAKPLETPFRNDFTILADLEDGLPTESEETPTEPNESPTESEETTTETEEATSEEETPETCYDQVKGIGWLVCPTTGVLAEAVDSIYSIIEKMLIVQPISTDSESPIFIVWQYVRDLTNIVFIILIIVVIYSQLTGVGFDNYNIKKILPKLIITAILINLSYLICSALVDTSNIIGASLRGFFENIESNINASGDAMVTWGGLAAALTSGGAIAGFAISASGGLGAFIWVLLPAILSAALAILVGFITIAMRQAVVALLVMIAPLAFVCYMLPNTNKWFTKWKDIFASMLIFFPMFSALFGASHLAGWALIAKAQQDGSYPMLVLGMAVQVVPLFLCWSLMKMSGSVLGQVSNKLSGLANGINAKARAAADDRRDTARARKLAEASTRNFNPVSGASWSAFLRRQQALRAESRAKNEETVKNVGNIYSNARRTGRRIVGWREDGTPIYATRTLRDANGKVSKDEFGNDLTAEKIKVNRDMREEYRNRQMALRASGERDRLEGAMGEIGAYMKEGDFKDSALQAMSKGQAKNFEYSMTQKSALARNARADQRYYTEQIRKASERDEQGRIKNIRDYNRLIKAGAGADAYDTDETIQQNAITTVTADAYDAYEKERAITSQRYTTLFDKQVTKDVLAQYKSALKSTNIDAITAAQNTLMKRGDLDKISENLRNFMDQTGEYANLGEDKRLRLGTDFANVLASNLLSMKGADPILGRLGKSINMETWQSTNGNRSEIMTFYDYIYGNKNGGQNQARTSITELLKGTSIKDADRTFFGDLRDTAAAYNFSEEEYTQLIKSMMPQFISGIPTFESGSEQIIGSMRTLTGMAKDSNDHWVNHDKDGNPLQIHTDLIRTYIKGMTDKDLNSFKTDAFEAICEAIAQTNGTTCYDNDGKFKADVPTVVQTTLREYADNDMLATIQNNVNQGTNVGMKPKIMRAFGIKAPDSYQATDN